MKLSVNFKSLSLNYLPSFLRKTTVVYWAWSLLKPLITLHTDSTKTVNGFGQTNLSFVQWQTFIRDYLRFNAQVCYLQRFLNDIYLPLVAEPYIDNSGIYIENTNDRNITYLYNIAELKPDTYLFNDSEGEVGRYLFNDGEEDTWLDFIVWVPATLTFDSDLMEGRINRYKLAGTNYDIQTY